MPNPSFIPGFPETRLCKLDRSCNSLNDIPLEQVSEILEDAPVKPDSEDKPLLRIVPLPYEKSEIMKEIETNGIRLPSCYQGELEAVFPKESAKWIQYPFTGDHEVLILSNNADKFLRFAQKYFAVFPRRDRLKIAAIVHADPRVKVFRRYQIKSDQDTYLISRLNSFSVRIRPSFSFNLEEYYRSDDWIEKSSELRKRIRKCQICGTLAHKFGPGALCVHHNAYENIPNEKPEDLIVVCGRCHTLIHQRRKVER